MASLVAFQQVEVPKLGQGIRSERLLQWHHCFCVSTEKMIFVSQGPRRQNQEGLLINTTVMDTNSINHLRQGLWHSI